MFLSVGTVMAAASFPATAGADRVAGRPSARIAGSVLNAESAIRGCANRQRRGRGVPALRRSRALDRAARLHARNMLWRGFFDHTDPFGRGPEDRVRRFDSLNQLTSIGENIAAGYRSASAACRGRMGSRGHRANILDPAYTRVGAGYAVGRRGYRKYYAQVFGDVVPQGLPPVAPLSPPLPAPPFPTPEPARGRVRVVIENVDDYSWVAVDNRVVEPTVGYGGNADIDLGELSEASLLSFTVANSGYGGWAYGWSVFVDGRRVFDEADGVAGQVGARGNDSSCINRICYQVTLRPISGQVVARQEPR